MTLNRRHKGLEGFLKGVERCGWVTWDCGGDFCGHNAISKTRVAPLHPP